MTITFTLGIWHLVTALVISYIITCLVFLLGVGDFQKMPLWKRIFIFPFTFPIKIGYAIYWMFRRLFKSVPFETCVKVQEKHPSIRFWKITSSIRLYKGWHTGGLDWWHRYNLVRVTK
jgi:hypothetical protein